MRESGENGVSIGAYEAKSHLSALLARVLKGEEITITRHGSPIARLVPVKSKASPAERHSAIERWIESSHGLSLGGLKIRDLIDEGRW